VQAEARCIRVVGARQHNLQNVTVELPRDRLIVITGISGSGKSSLAFDTIYAEGQRRYVESLSVHARHYLEQLSKPEVDRIEGLPPTLAIEQRAAAANPRSIVATTTEIYDFLRLLYARVGSPHCPSCGQPVRRYTVDQIVDRVLSFPPGRRLMVLAPLVRCGSADQPQVLRRIQREGFVRARVNGVLHDVKDLAELPKGRKVDIDVVVDRLTIRPEIRSRLADAIELSFGVSDGVVIVSCEEFLESGDGAAPNWRDETFSERYACTACGVTLPELSPRMFSFNSPYGACPGCGGLGTTLQFDEQLIVPDENLSLLDAAIAPWSGKKLAAAGRKMLRELCSAFGVSPQTPFQNLPQDLRRIVLYGTRRSDEQAYGVRFEGVIPSLERRLRASGANGRSRLASFQSEHVCERCNGARLRPEPLAVRIAGLNIWQVVSFSIARAANWFERLRFDGEVAAIAEPILREVRQRLRFMVDIGLSYLTLDRLSVTLSGGEAQRIRLATQLGSGLVGVCYVLDEPTIGLHPRDNARLLRSVRNLVDMGNTAIVVEHDEDVIRAADYLVDMGPGAGQHGGRIVAAGPPEVVLNHPASLTGKFVRGEYTIPLPEQRRSIRRSEFLEIVGAAENNLKHINVRIPLGAFCAITGVSGSGKSTLVSQILLPALRRRLYRSREKPGAHERLIGAARVDRVIEIDQSPIGRTPRSNPATYTGVFDEIRRLYARTKEARIRGYTASRFSFNAKGGRCEACAGQGTRRIEMHFLPDVFVECQECRGTRYNRETLEIRYRGKSIADVLEMRVEEALRFFDSFPKIRRGLQALSDVGLGYIRLGQPSNTLSGGEAQRVKLAAELAKGDLCLPVPGGPNAAARQTSHTLYVLDEPTTGLHFADIQTLLAVLNRLVDMGNTVLVIEHNLDVIKSADWIIDLGPEGGDAGGQIVAEGPPEVIAECRQSYTGSYLRRKLGLDPVSQPIGQPVSLA